MQEIFNIFKYIHFTPLLIDKISIYFTTVGIIVLINYIITIIIIVMAFRIKNNKLNILWPLYILKFFLPFLSFTFFSQSFLLLSTIFDCKEGFSYVSTTMKCRSGTWFAVFGPLSGTALFLQSFNAIITNSLYFKPIFYNRGSDLLKKTSSFPDFISIMTKICVNILFISDKGQEDEHWAILTFLIIFNGTNAYYYLYYQNRANKALTTLNNIFCLITLLAYISLFIGKVFKALEFTGTIYLFLSGIIIIIIFVFIYKDNEIDFVLLDYSEINNPIDYLYYVSTYFNIIEKRDKSRDNLIILKSLIAKIEQNCILIDCPLKKYIEHLKNGIECPFLLNEYCQILFEYGISKFTNDQSLKNNYAIFLITTMNYKKKALIILNSIKANTLSFQNKFDIYRTLRLVDKWNFSRVHKNNSTFEYRKNIHEFKFLIKTIFLLYHDFISLILNSKLENVDNFDKIHNIGLQIMKCNPKMEEIYTKLISIKTDNIKIIKLYSEFVDKILKDEEKLEICKKVANLAFSSVMYNHEKDYSNYDLDILNDNGHIPYLVISTYKEHFGKIIEISMRATKIFGYTKSELIGQHINILIPKIFHKKHNTIIYEKYEKDKINFLNNLNKKMIYFPDFIKKEAVGISKMKFLIELKLNIFYVKTEDNHLVYIVEIIDYNPLMLDLIKNFNNHLKCCVLTDDNFLIQTFTPNCIEHLKLNYADIKSNFSIINNIKQFQEDYLNAINHLVMNMHSYINSGEIIYEDRLSEKRNVKYSIPHSIKKKIKYDLLLKKYSKKCKITWSVGEDDNLNQSKDANKNFISKKSQNSIRYTKSNIYRHNKTNNSEIEIDAFMEIKPVIISDELLGYYFYFTEVKNTNYNNMSYIIQKNDTIGLKDDIIQLKLKKYQCKFKTQNQNFMEETKYSSGKNQLFSSFIEKSYDNNYKSGIINLKRQKRRKSLDKKTISVSFNEKKSSLNSLSFIGNKKSVDKALVSYRFDNNDNDSLIITGDFIPDYTCHFSINLSNKTFYKITGKDFGKSKNYLDQIKKEAEDKLNSYQQLIKYIYKNSNTSSNESEEYESNDYSSSGKINSNSIFNNNDSSNTNSNSLNENKKEQSIKIKNSNKKEIKEKENENDKKAPPLPILKNWIKRDNYESNSDINAAVNISNKSLPKRDKRDLSYYRVNLKNIIYMIYDFNKEVIIEDTKIKKLPQVEIVKIMIMNENKKQDSEDPEKHEHEHYSFFSPLNNNTNKNKKNKKKTENSILKKKNNDINNTNQNVINKLNEEKLMKKKIYESLNRHKTEPPIKKLKIFSFCLYIFVIIFGVITIILNAKYLGYLKINLINIKYSIFLSYFSHISVYYIRELTLLNFYVGDIEGAGYLNYTANNKEEYISLIMGKLSDLFLENQYAMKILYSSSLPLSKNISDIITKTELIIKLSIHKKININYDILTALMQYSSSLYNIVSATFPIEQNFTDVYCYIYNNLNGFKKGINILIDALRKQLLFYNKEIIIRLIIIYIALLFCFIILYIFIILYLLSSLRCRANYMKVFYGINESILKKTINCCEKLLNKVRIFEEENNNEEDTSFENSDGKVTLGKNQKITKKEKSLQHENYSLNDSSNENSKQKIISFFGISFLISYFVFILICSFYFVMNGFGIFNESKEAILKADICQRILDIQISIIDAFNSYREFLFDNQSSIDNLTPREYIDKMDKEQFSKFVEKMRYININSNSFPNNISNLIEEKNLCNYYINDFFDSSAKCEEEIGLISKYNFNTLAIYFIGEIKIKKNVVQYKLLNENILGNLTEYNYTDYINNDLIPKNGQPSNHSNHSSIFRLNLFNNYTIHYQLNIIFFSIILPYIEKNREEYFSILTFETKEGSILFLNLLILVIISLIFFCFFIPVINYINSIIYKAKNMLSIIPLTILSYQSDALILLNISNNK